MRWSECMRKQGAASSRQSGFKGATRKGRDGIETHGGEFCGHGRSVQSVRLLNSPEYPSPRHWQSLDRHAKIYKEVVLRSCNEETWNNSRRHLSDRVRCAGRRELLCLISAARFELNVNFNTTLNILSPRQAIFVLAVAALEITGLTSA